MRKWWHSLKRKNGLRRLRLLKKRLLYRMKKMNIALSIAFLKAPKIISQGDCWDTPVLSFLRMKLP